MLIWERLTKNKKTDIKISAKGISAHMIDNKITTSAGLVEIPNEC